MQLHEGTIQAVRDWVRTIGCSIISAFLWGNTRTSCGYFRTKIYLWCYGKRGSWVALCSLRGTWTTPDFLSGATIIWYSIYASLAPNRTIRRLFVTSWPQSGNWPFPGSWTRWRRRSSCMSSWRIKKCHHALRPRAGHRATFRPIYRHDFQVAACGQLISIVCAESTGWV